MIDLQPLFTNFYADRNHSFVELSRYGSKHLIYLTANNPGGVLDDVITEVTTAFTLFAACLGDEEALAALREAANQSRDNLRKSMSGPTGAVSRASGAVAGAFGKPSPDYTTCFPLGVEGIVKASNALMAERLENLRVALVARTGNAAITPHVTTITALHTQWVALNTAAGTALGAESATEDTRDTCRAAVTRAFTRSALWLAWHFNGQPEKFALYCPVHLLKNPLHPGGPGAATLSAGAWDAGTHIAPLTMDAEGATVFTLQDRAVGAGAFVTVLDDIAADATGHATFDYELATGAREVRVIPRNGDGVEGDPSEVVTVTAA